MTEANGMRARLSRALYRPVDGASLAAFRIAFGLLMFFGTVRFMLTGWVRTQYVEPTFFFKYPGFEFVRAWPEWGMYLHLGLVAVLALMVAAGLFYRVSVVLFALAFAWIQLIDVTNYLNHYYFVVLLAGILAVVPAHRTFSLDALRNPAIASETIPAWAVYLLRFQVGIVYFNAGLAKLGADWLLHAQPLGIWMSARTDMPLLGPILAWPWVPFAMAWAGFLFDTTIVLWLSLRRTRPYAYAVVIVFHLLTHLFFNIGMFPLIMVTAALVFFPPDWPRRLLRGKGDRLLFGAKSSLSPFPRRLGLTLAALWCVLQIALPLRHFAYPGEVLWNEEGMRFSWKVMVREKNGSVTFHVRDPETGRQWQVNPAKYLMPRQAVEMSAQPDLILQLAHHVADDFRSRGFGDVEVRAETLVSLNGRKPAPMIDPSVDLTRVRLGLAAATWILPEPSDSPLPVFPRRNAALAVVP